MQIIVNQVTLTFKLDTEAEVTAISEETFKALGSQTPQAPVKKLCMWPYKQATGSLR